MAEGPGPTIDPHSEPPGLAQGPLGKIDAWRRLLCISLHPRDPDLCPWQDDPRAMEPSQEPGGRGSRSAMRVCDLGTLSSPLGTFILEMVSLVTSSPYHQGSWTADHRMWPRVGNLKSGRCVLGGPYGKAGGSEVAPSELVRAESSVGPTWLCVSARVEGCSPLHGPSATWASSVL